MSQNQRLRGIDASKEVREDLLERDTRSGMSKFADWIKQPSHMAIVLGIHASTAFVTPELSDVAFLSATGFFAWGMKRGEYAPIKIPKQAKLPDYNQPHPKTGKPTEGDGIFFLGNELKTGKEIWLTNDDCRQHFLIVGTTGAGKALPVDALVHTPEGWRRNGDLAQGDTVSTPDGRSAKILGVYPQGSLEMRSVHFADGRVVKACPEHLWEVWCEDIEKPSIWRTQDIEKALAAGRKLSVRLTAPVEKPATDQRFDPYYVGCYLGDLSLSLYGFRRAFQEAWWAGHCPLAEGHLLGVEPVDREVTVAEFQSVFGREAGKRIPEAYRNGSLDQRWALLRGLCDAEATPSAQGIELVVQGEDLARDVREVVWSVGGAAKLTPLGGVSYVYDFEVLEDKFHLLISHPTPSQFFSDAKKQRSANGTARVDRLQIVAATPDKTQEAMCIYIDHPDHLYITDNYIVTHNTETLLGFAANALLWGSGFLFCDGKGDVALFSKVYALARRFGREDDLLVLNFMTGNKDVGASGGELLSNTMNPFTSGSSDSLTQMVVSLMDDAGGDGAMWKGRATSMLTGLMRALTWLRDQGIVDLNVGEIRDFMNLRKIIDLGNPEMYPEMPGHIRKSILSYLTSLPGYAPEKGYKQSQTTLDQHGYLEMQFTKILGNLADVYGHIFKTSYGEVDMYDVVLNRRILVIMLPALEKANDEIANLGKIVVSNLKGMMGATLGSRIEGSWDEVVENRPTSSPSPFLCILDEVGYYTVEGMALMAAQARSLGFAMVYASQDIPAMKRLNDKEAASIIANTNTKIFMRTEEAGESGKLAIDAAGQAYRAQAGGWQGESGGVGVGYRDTMEAKYEKVERVNFIDLKAQGSGMMHVLFQDKIVRARGLYANPEGSLNKKKLKIRTNHFIAVPRPDLEALADNEELPLIAERLMDPGLIDKLVDEEKARLAAVPRTPSDEISVVATVIKRMRSSKRSSVEAACAALAALMESQRGNVKIFNEAVKAAGPKREGASEARVRNDRHVDEPQAQKPLRDDRRSEELNMPVDDDTVPLSDLFDMDDSSAGDGFDFQGGEQDDGTPEDDGLRKTVVRKSVRHGATIDDGEIVDMADNIAKNESIMRALRALDFSGDEASPEEVEQEIDEAIPPYGKRDDLSEYGNADDVTGALGDFDAAMGDAYDPAAFGGDEDDDEGRTDPDDAGSKSGESSASDSLAEEFLRGLMSGDDEK